MKDLYPKVTNFYFISSGSKSDGKWKADKKRILIAAGCMSLVQMVYTLLTDTVFEWTEAVLALPLGFGFAGFYKLFSRFVLSAVPVGCAGGEGNLAAGGDGRLQIQNYSEAEGVRSRV